MEVAAAGWGYLFEQNYEKGVSMIDYRDNRLLRTLFWECHLFKSANGLELQIDTA